MEKRGNIATGLLLIFLIALLVLAAYFLYIAYLDMTAQPVTLVMNKSSPPEPIGPSFSGQSQFYPNMRFANKRISYSISEECSGEKTLRVVKALNRLENETSLEFYQTDKARIFITCEEMEEPMPGEYFVAGEGGPTKLVNTSLFYVVEEGKVLLLYEDSRCNNYNVELHELLHVFGFKHSKNENSIMYNTTRCDQKLTDDIIERLNKLYLIESLPDLTFENVEANKIGRYLNFKVEIRNQGLSKARNVELSIRSEEKIEEFDLGDISYGAGKVFRARNVKLPSRNVETLKFIIEAGEELELKNNEVELSVAIKI